jgi:hypothetical protein
MEVHSEDLGRDPFKILMGPNTERSKVLDPEHSSKS